MIYNFKKYLYLAFGSFLGPGLQTPWGFPTLEQDQGVFGHVKEVTFGEPLQVGAGCHGASSVIREWELPVSSSF